jgi:TolB protein
MMPLKRVLVRSLCFALLLSVVPSFCFIVHAQDRVHIDITRPNFERIPIAIPDFKYLSPEQVQLANEMAAALSTDLDYSGIFRPLDPRGFLEDPQNSGVTAGDIKFSEWRKLGAEFLVRSTYRIEGSTLKLEGRLFDVVGMRMVFGKVYEVDARNWRAVIHRFADEILMLLTGERGVFDTKIAYVQVNGKNKEIYVVDFDGSNPTPLTNDQNLNLSPAWSSEGDQLAYVSYREGNAKIYAANLLNGSQRLLCGYPGINIAPAWRPGGRELAVTLSKDGNPDIYLVSSGGEVIRKLVQSWAINVSPSWSPDGKRLAYVSNEGGNPQIYVLDVASGLKRRISFSGKYNTSPSWSPKGDYIAYSASIGGRHNIMMVKPDGSDARQMTRGEGDNESPTWSPDGRMLAFSSTRQGGSAIWVLMTNGTGIRRLTRSGGGQEMPEWSPRLGGR